VYVQSFPIGRGKLRVSLHGGKLAVLGGEPARVSGISADGQRILALAAVGDKAEPTMTMIVNWRALLTR
jgi:hypothetical protein